MDRLLAEITAASLLALGCYYFYTDAKNARERAAILESEVKAEKANAKIVTQYVDRKVEIVRRVPVIQRELVRVCDDATGLHGPGGADAAPGAEADNVLAGLAGEVGNCLSESAQLAALIEVLKPQVR